MGELVMNPTVVTINGVEFTVVRGLPLSFEGIADMAGYKTPALPSITVKHPEAEGRILAAGESVIPVNGIVFNVYDTSNA